jgi:hypothetical protein
MKRALLTICLLAPGLEGAAGELECFLGCRFDTGLTRATWKSTSCFKPTAPFIFVSNVEEYNFAVQQFNSWLDQMRMYATCVAEEAARDAEKASKLVLEGAEKFQGEAIDEISRQRSLLLMSRPLR